MPRVRRTKIVATLGPATESDAAIDSLIKAGVDVVRLNFSHGDFHSHKRVIENLRATAQAMGRRVAIMADLPGPKMRIGQLENEPITVFGEGQQTRSFCYVSDLVEGIYRLLMSDYNMPVNIGNPREMTILALAETIKEMTGAEYHEYHDEGHCGSDSGKTQFPEIAAVVSNFLRLGQRK